MNMVDGPQDPQDGLKSEGASRVARGGLPTVRGQSAQRPQNDRAG